MNGFTKITPSKKVPELDFNELLLIFKLPISI